MVVGEKKKDEGVVLREYEGRAEFSTRLGFCGGCAIHRRWLKYGGWSDCCCMKECEMLAREQ